MRLEDAIARMSFALILGSITFLFKIDYTKYSAQNDALFIHEVMLLLIHIISS